MKMERVSEREAGGTRENEGMRGAEEDIQRREGRSKRQEPSNTTNERREPPGEQSDKRKRMECKKDTGMGGPTSADRKVARLPVAPHAILNYT